MRLTAFLMMICAPFLMAGSCVDPDIQPVIEAPLFCDVEQPRRFTQAELDWRAANAPDNLRLDFKTNTSWDRECRES